MAKSKKTIKSTDPKKTNPLKEIHIEFKYLMIIIFVAMLSYVLYYFKFPNTWAALINLTLVVLLIMDFKDIKGVKVIVYAMILSVLLLPTTVFMLNMPVIYQLIVFLVNITLMILIAIGLKNLRRWGYYLGIIIFILSVISLVLTTIPALKGFVWNQFFVTITLKQLTSAVFFALAAVYLLKHRRYFR